MPTADRCVLSVDELTELFVNDIERSEDYKRSLEAAAVNSQDTVVALFGSNVYLRLFRLIHDRETRPSRDYDYLTRKKSELVPPGWSYGINRSNNPKLVHGPIPAGIGPAELKEYADKHNLLVADVTLLCDVYQIWKFGREPTLANILNHTPTDFGAVAYLPKERRIVDAGAIEAIYRSRVGVKDLDVLEHHCIPRGKSVAQYLEQKNRQLGL